MVCIYNYSSVGMATGCTAGVRFPTGQEFIFSVVSIAALGPPRGYRRLYPGGGGGKRPRCERDHSPPPRAQVKNGGAIPPLVLN
jgi:hypothetical protein